MGVKCEILVLDKHLPRFVIEQMSAVGVPYSESSTVEKLNSLT